jgi:hypothetical protein
MGGPEGTHTYPWASLKPPKGFSEGKPKAASEARPEAKNPRGRRPRGFLASGLAEDAAAGLPEENPEGGFRLALG